MLRGLNDLITYICLLPLTEIHPDAQRKPEWAWCARNLPRIRPNAKCR